MNIEYVLDDKIQCKSTKMDLVLIFGANCIVFYIFLFFIVLLIAPLITTTKNQDKLDNYNVDVTEF